MRSKTWFYLFWLLLCSNGFYFFVLKKENTTVIEVAPLNEKKIEEPHRKLAVIQAEKILLEQGDTFKAKIIAGTFIPDKEGRVTVNGNLVGLDENGLGEYKEVASILGLNTIRAQAGSPCCALTGETMYAPSRASFLVVEKGN